MNSKAAVALRLKYDPVALLWTNERPAQAIQFQEGKWGCVMAMFAQAAVGGKTAVFDRETFGCLGGGTGLGFGDQYLNWRGGLECFYGFLSTGNADREDAQELAEQVRREGRKVAVERFLHGERIVKSPELARLFVASLPTVDIPYRYVIFKPLRDVRAGESPQVVIFVANPDQLSALVSLANYGRGTTDNVVMRSGAGCHNIGIMASAESRKDVPRAVVGMTDVAARVYTRQTLGHDVLTFAVPFKMFIELEANVEGSFLEKETWRTLVGIREGGE